MQKLVLAILGSIILFAPAAGSARGADADSVAKAKKKWEKAYADAQRAIANARQARAQLAAVDPRNPSLTIIDNRISYAAFRLVDTGVFAPGTVGLKGLAEWATANGKFDVAVSAYHNLTAYAQSAESGAKDAIAIVKQAFKMIRRR